MHSDAFFISLILGQHLEFDLSVVKLSRVVFIAYSCSNLGVEEEFSNRPGTQCEPSPFYKKPELVIGQLQLVNRFSNHPPTPNWVETNVISDKRACEEG